MNGDEPILPPDPVTTNLDPDALKDAHGRTGRMLKSAGLPFEDDEFDDADDDSSSSSSSEDGDESSSSSSSDEPV
jgi:hypothetical protein